jgi:hypothetical protein
VRAALRHHAANVVLLVVTLALAWLAAEAAVRALYKQSTVHFPRYHTGYSYGRYQIRGVRQSVPFVHSSVDGSWEFVTNSPGLPQPAGVRL